MILAQTQEEIQNNQVLQNQTQNTIVAQPANQNPEPKIKHNIKGIIFHWWHKIALILLTLHGIFGLFESVKFLFIEYPQLNQMLELHQVNVHAVNHLLAQVIITITVTFVNVLFAIRLSKVTETTAHNIDLLVATFLIISTQFIQKFLIQLDLLNLVLSLFS